MNFKTDNIEKLNFDLYLITETDRAILVSELPHYESDSTVDPKDFNPFWLPKSQISFSTFHVETDPKVEIINITMPEWLAIEKELI